MLKLIKPTKEYEQQAKDYIEEFYEYNSKIYGVSYLDKYLKEESYDNWLDHLEIESKIETTDRVKGTTYFLIDAESNKIIGMTNIRHSLNEFLSLYGGHIGYSVRPLERRKGYAKIMLYLALEKCEELGIKDALVTADEDNAPSYKTIEALGGVLENKVIEDEETLVRRYWIDVEKALKEYKNEYSQNEKSVIR